MKLAISTAFISLVLTCGAHAQSTEPSVVAQVLSRGVRDVCVRSYVLSAQVRNGVISEVEARRTLAGVGGWTPADPPVPGAFPYIDPATATYLSAQFPDAAEGRVVAAVELSPTRPSCQLVALAAPNAAHESIAAFGSDFTPLRVPSASQGSGIDMFGLRVADSGPDFGITIYSPMTQAVRDMGIDALVAVGLIPRDAIDSGVFSAARR